MFTRRPAGREFRVDREVGCEHRLSSWESLVARRRALLVLLSGLALLASTLGARAASPAAGHIGPKNPKLAYATSMQYGSLVGVVGFEGVDCPPASQDPVDAVCDHFTITVDVPRSYWKMHDGGVQVLVPTSFYGYAYTPDNRIAAASGWTGEPHLMTIPEAAGTYEIRLAPYLAFGPSDVTARFVSTPGAAKRLRGDAFAAYHGTTLTKQPKTKPANKPISYSGEKLAFRSTYVGRGAAEPTIGVDKKGDAFFAAGAFDALPENSPRNQARTVILRSADQNKTWRSVQPPPVQGLPGDGHPVTLDPYVYVDPQFGRVFDVDLTLAGSYLSFSDDQGKTWTRGEAISVFGANDHQTLFAGPPPLGLPTLDPAFPKVVYYCVNQIDGSYCARSLDGGRSFTNAGTPAFLPADPAAQNGVPFCGGLHGHGVTDSKGRVFLPRGFCGAPVLGVSEDGGSTWGETRVLPEGSSIGASGIQTSVAVDSKDNLYYVWWDDQQKLPYLAVSRDHGVSFTRPRMIAPPGVQAVNFPTIDAGSPGRIAITFPGTLSKDPDDITRPWFSYVVESVDALSQNPTFLSVVANPGGLADPIHRGDCDARCGRMYDFLDIVVAPDAAGTVWATATDTCTAVAECSSRRVAGFSFNSGEHGASDSRDGVVYRQISGPRMVVDRRY
jgi:hypothetical protein